MASFVAPAIFPRKDCCITSKSASAPAKHFCRMSSTISRRRFGQLIAGASVLALTDSRSFDSAIAKEARPVFIKDESGISYYDVKPGSGAAPIEGDFVVVDYLAFLSNGKLFDNRKGFVFQIGRRQIIPGLEQAISTMRPGGERKVVVPANLAYGDKGVCLEKENECLVPPGETLGYSVTLQRVAVPPT